MATKKENTITSTPSLRASHCEEERRGKLKQSHNVTATHEQITSAKKPRNDVPKLRFKEFEGEWEENNNKIKILSGNSYSLNSYTNKGVFLIQGLNISPGFINIEKPIYIDEKNNDYNHIMVNTDDILIGLNRPIVSGKLKVALFNGIKAFLYQRAGILKFDTEKINNHFLYQYLRSTRFLKKISLELVGSDQPYIKSNLFDVTKNIFPPLPEQQKIANFLSAVDTKTQQLTTKKELLQQYKKGVMQQLFSQKLRFKDDNGKDFPDWEEKKLGEVCEKIQDGNYGASYPKANEFIEIGIPFLTSKALGTGGSIISDKIDFIPIEKHLELKKAHLKLNDILFTNRGANVGAIAFVNETVAHGNIGPQLTLLRVNKEIIKSNFLLHSMNSFDVRKQIRSQDSGSAMNFFGIGATSKFKVKLPPLKEQLKIANYLSALDTKIAAVETLLTKTQQFKKGLLQQMFV